MCVYVCTCVCAITCFNHITRLYIIYKSRNRAIEFCVCAYTCNYAGDKVKMASILHALVIILNRLNCCNCASICNNYIYVLCRYNDLIVSML